MSGLSDNDQDAVKAGNRGVERQLVRNWYLLAGITVVSTVGLVVALAPLLSARIVNVWPWANTNIVLLGGLASCVALLVWHLTVQQRRVLEISEHIRQIEEDAKSRRRQQGARLHALLNVSRMMGAVTDPENIFKGITNTCLEIFECQQASLMLIEGQENRLQVRAATGHIDGEKVGAADTGVGEGIAGWVAEHQRSLILGPKTDMSRYPGLELRSLDLTAAMVVPIVTRDELVGVLNISSRVPDVEYTEEDLRALEVFAENAGACIRYMERAEWMRQVIEKQSSAQDHLAQQRSHDPVPTT